MSDVTESVGVPEQCLNMNVRGLPQSATLAINERSAALQEAGHKIFRLGLGQSPFPVPETVVEALRANAHQKDYLPVRGLPALREAIAAYHRRLEGIDCAAADVLIGPGSKELLFLIQLVHHGELVVPTPCWVSYEPQAMIIGRRIQRITTRFADRWRITPTALDELCRKDPGRPRIVILNYPDNPSGATYSGDELRALAAVARRYRLILVADEIYGGLNFAGNHQSIARYYPEGTIISGGLSKWCGAGGWRLGAFTFPAGLRWLLDAMAVVASETYTSTSAPVQFAAVRAFSGSEEIEHYLFQSRRILKTLGIHLYRRMNQAGIRLAPPEGGFYLFPDFSPFAQSLTARGIHTSAALCEQLLSDTGVAMLPGSVFGRADDELTARLAYVDFDGAAALAAAESVLPDRPLDERFLQQYCARMLEAIGRICAWVGARAPR